MRSVSTSACFISSNDSCRVYFASFVQPQFSCIFACRKYWLIAVSSAVSCSLRYSMTFGSPCIGRWPPLVCRQERSPGAQHLCRRRVVDRPRPHDDRCEPFVTGPAPGARAAGASDLLDRLGAGGDLGLDVGDGHRVTDAGVHGTPCERSGRRRQVSLTLPAWVTRRPLNA